MLLKAKVALLVQDVSGEAFAMSGERLPRITIRCEDGWRRGKMLAHFSSILGGMH